MTDSGASTWKSVAILLTTFTSPLHRYRYADDQDSLTSKADAQIHDKEVMICCRAKASITATY